MNTSLLLLLIGWLTYFALHSLLASLAMKQKVAAVRRQWMPRYRIVFNTLAILLLLPLLYLWQQAAGEPIWQRPETLRWVFDALALAALIGFIHSTRYYDMGEFFGWRQWRGKVTSVEDQEHLQLSPYHRFIRHPWYFFALVLLWTRDMDPASLLSISFITAYFVIGSRLEERKLRQYYGQAYADYCRAVPGLIPLPGKYLSKAQAQALESRA